MGQIEDLDSRIVEFPGLGWVPKVAICDKKVVIRTFRTVLRKKKPKNSEKRQFEDLHFWCLKSPIFPGT